MASTNHAFTQRQTRSYDNLEKARHNAATKSGYDSLQTRLDLTRIFRETFDNDPHEWQLDTTEAILLGLDSLVIARTGSGKTMPFMLPLKLDPKRKVIIISPLKVLQDDQVARFREAGLTATAVNGDTWNDQLRQDLENGRFQAIFASPEMCIEHPGFRSMLSNSIFRDVCAIIIDEAHCISQWGGDFRKAYANLSELRPFFPLEIPILATTATLDPGSLKVVKNSLGLRLDTGFHLNLGNDRPNVTYLTHAVKSADDINAIKPFLFDTPNPTTPADLTKTIVFLEGRLSAQQVHRAIQEWLPPELHNHVDYIHALRSTGDKRGVMKRFREGKVTILVATESAGMGADIPDVVRVIQLGVPKSLSIWFQRAGRAGRRRDLQAEAILLYEKSIFKQRRKKKPKGPASQEEEPNEDSDNGDGEPDEESLEWGKKVEEALRRWIETARCRRDIADDYFGNPPNRQAATGACCDNCDGFSVRRPCTPPNASYDSSPHTTPSKSADKRGKRKLQLSAPTTSPSVNQTRSKKHREEIVNALDAWRYNTVLTRLPHCPITASAFLSDSVISTLSSSCEIHTVSDIKAKVKWPFTTRFGPDILSVIGRIDRRYLEASEAKLRQAKEQQEKKRVAAEQRERKRVERGLNQLQKEIEAQLRKDARESKLRSDRVAKETCDDENALRRAHKRIVKDSEKDRVPLNGLSVMSLPSSNIPSTPNPFITTPGPSVHAHAIPALSPLANDLPSPYSTLLNFSISTPASFSTPTATKPTRRRNLKTSANHTQIAKTPPSTSQTPLACSRPRPRPRPIFQSQLSAPVQSGSSSNPSTNTPSKCS